MAQNNTAPSASSRVFDIPELLEHILVQYADMRGIVNERRTEPVQELFIWQRVNCNWRNTIQDSTHLQRAMFLEFEADEDSRDEQRRPKNACHALNWLTGSFSAGQWVDVCLPNIRIIPDLPLANRVSPVTLRHAGIIKRVLANPQALEYESWTSMKSSRTKVVESLTARLDGSVSKKSRETCEFHFDLIILSTCSLGDVAKFYIAMAKLPEEKWRLFAPRSPFGTWAIFEHEELESPCIVDEKLEIGPRGSINVLRNEW